MLYKMKSSNSLLVFKQCSVLFNTNRICLGKALAHGMAVNFLGVLIFINICGLLGNHKISINVKCAVI